MDYRYESISYETGHYGGLTFTPIIIQGKLYYEARSTAQTIQGYYAVDLYTGETLSFDNNTMPAFGSIYNYESPNQHGGFSYLWRTSGVTLPSGYTSRSGTTTWEMLDGFTGNTITKIANVTCWGYSRLRQRRKHIALQLCHDRWGTVFTGLELICNAYYAIGNRRNRFMAMETRKAGSS